MAIGRINGDHINGFSSREMYGRFAGPKNLEAVRRGSMVVRGSGSGIGSHWSGAQW